MEKTIQQQVADKEAELSQLKKQLEEDLNKNNPIHTISDYKSVCDKLQVSDDDNTIKVEVPGFDENQTKVVKAFIKKMRICEVYNGKKKIGRNENRHWCWYRKGSSGSGLDFYYSTYGIDYAVLSSADRLSFRDNATLMDFVKKFKYIDEQIIDIE